MPRTIDISGVFVLNRVGFQDHSLGPKVHDGRGREAL